jgi:hypothetical protein
MWEWWLVRAVEYRGLLAAAEWAQLAAAGRQWHLAPGQRLIWGPAPGVVLVSQGALRLSYETARCQNTLHLQHGDMAGTVQPLSCQLWTEHAATLHLFHHAEWLAALDSAPNLTQKLLRAIASNALRAEQQLPPSTSSASITAG